MVISNLNTKLIQDRLGFVVSCVERLVRRWGRFWKLITPSNEMTTYPEIPSRLDVA